MKRVLKNLLCLFIFLIFTGTLCAAETNQTDTPSSATANLLDVQKMHPELILDIKYATKDNFTHEVLYDEAKFYLRETTAKKFLSAVKEFNKMGYKVKVFDGYRSLSVQKKMWKILPDEKFVADPAKGSRHNRGGAIDMALVDKSGKEIDMGTPYDDFTERAHPQYKNLPEQVLKNRQTLKEVMEKNGFSQFPTEWWHFDDTDWEQFAILDKDFSQLK